MSKNPNDAENTSPYPEIEPEVMREHAEKHGNSGDNEQINPGHMRSQAEKHGNLGYNEQIDAEEMRSEAERHGTTSSSHHARHEREIARLDHKAGHEKGGR